MSYLKTLSRLRSKFYGESGLASDNFGLNTESAKEPTNAGFMRRAIPEVKKKARANLQLDVPKAQEQPSLRPKVDPEEFYSNFGMLFNNPTGVPQKKPVGITGEVSPLDYIKETSENVKLFTPVEIQADKEFLNEVTRVANKFEVNPNDLLAVMHFETGGSFDPSVKNPRSTATGLIQFLESTARGLGTTTEELSKMSRAEQMAYVEKYLDQWADRIRGGSIEDLYMAVLRPASAGKDSNSTLFSEGSRAYEVNKGLDANKDGAITKAEAAEPVRRRRSLMERKQT